MSVSLGTPPQEKHSDTLLELVGPSTLMNVHAHGSLQAGHTNTSFEPLASTNVGFSHSLHAEHAR
jgi:hypothetical protein